MPSNALHEWRTTRRQRLDELIAVHALIDPKRGPGRRAGTQQFNLAFIVVLAAEWQGFARALHDEAAARFAEAVAEAGSQQGAERLSILLIADRKLDRGNANQSAIAQDFGRLGISQLWTGVDAIDPRGKGRRVKLDVRGSADRELSGGQADSFHRRLRRNAPVVQGAPPKLGVRRVRAAPLARSVPT